MEEPVYAATLRLARTTVEYTYEYVGYSGAPQQYRVRVDAGVPEKNARATARKWVTQQKKLADNTAKREAQTAARALELVALITADPELTKLSAADQVRALLCINPDLPARALSLASGLSTARISQLRVKLMEGRTTP